MGAAGRNTTGYRRDMAGATVCHRVWQEEAQNIATGVWQEGAQQVPQGCDRKHQEKMWRDAAELRQEGMRWNAQGVPPQIGVLGCRRGEVRKGWNEMPWAKGYSKKGCDRMPQEESGMRQEGLRRDASGLRQ